MHDDDRAFTSMDAKIGSPTFHTWGLKSIHKTIIFTSICRLLLVMMVIEDLQKFQFSEHVNQCVSHVGNTVPSTRLYISAQLRFKT